MWTAVALISYAALFIFSIMALISFIKKTKKVSQYLFFVGVCCILIAFSLIIVPHMKQVQAKKADQASQKPMGAYAKSQLSVGDNGILNEDTFVSLGEDKDDFNTMQAYIASNDLASLKRLVKLGKVYFASQGTKIKLISKSFVRAKIEISSTGRIGFVPTVYLSKE
jgi:arginine exporter protein ArgO